MYNRYIRNDDGAYTRVTEPEVPQPPSPAQAQVQPPPPPCPSAPTEEPRRAEQPRMDDSNVSSNSGRFTDGLTGFLRHILDQLHLDHVDTGDLLLLGLLFFLSREDADEELLMALGLLLIL